MDSIDAEVYDLLGAEASVNDLEMVACELDAIARELTSAGRQQLASRLARAAGRVRGRAPLGDTGPLLTTGEAAAALGVRSVNTVKRWVQDGLLEGCRRGGRILITERSVRRMVDSAPVQGQRVFEGEIDQVHAAFGLEEAGTPAPATAAWSGRKPWERVVSS